MWTPKSPFAVGSSPQLKENDDSRTANSGINYGGSNKRSSPSPPSFLSSMGGRDRIYISTNTISAIQTEINNLPLPATLSNVCLSIRNSDAVLEAHADGEYYSVALRNNNNNNDDDKMKSFEILGDTMNELSLSPTQKRDKRKDEFRGACHSLVSGGNKIMLYSWDEVEKKLSSVFCFSKLNIVAPLSSNNNDVKYTGNIPTLTRGGRNQLLSASPKRTPKRAHRHSPKRSRHPIMKPKMFAKNVGLSVSAYAEKMKRGMGVEKYQQMFNLGEILSTQPQTKSIKEAAARYDEQIKQNEESERRSTQRINEIIAAKAKADKEREARESAMKLMRPLTEEEQEIVDSAVHGIGPPAEILASQDADSVQRGSMQTLQPGQWLNDEIINYFLKNCLAKRDEMLCAKQPGRKRSHFFNSFFVQTMFDEKNKNPKLRGKYNYKNVKRWGRKVPGKDIFNLKYIVMPINLDNMHWTSAVIFMEEKKIQYFDSMGGTDRAKLEGLLQYLKDEYKAKKGGEMDTSEWELVPCTRDTPRQRNGKCVAC